MGANRDSPPSASVGACLPTETELKRLLIVEDNAPQLEMMRDFLDGLMIFRVDVAGNVEDAMTLFESHRYFSIILDLHLGQSVDQGMDLAVHFRHADPDVYIAAISGYGPQLDRRLVGVVDVLLAKPVNYAQIQSKLIMWLVETDRRMSIKQYADTRIEAHDNKIEAYIETLARICLEHAAISEQLAELAEMIAPQRKDDDA